MAFLTRLPTALSNSLSMPAMLAAPGREKVMTWRPDDTASRAARDLYEDRTRSPPSCQTAPRAAFELGQNEQVPHRVVILSAC